MHSSVSFVVSLCLQCVLCSYCPRVSKRLFLVIIFLYLVMGKLFRLYFVSRFCIYTLCLPWHLVHLLVPFIMLDSFTLLCRHVYNWIQLFMQVPFLIRLQFTRLIKCLCNVSHGLAWFFSAHDCLGNSFGLDVRLPLHMCFFEMNQTTPS